MPEEQKNGRLPALLRRMLVHDDRRSEIFTYVCFGAGPILGSLVSFAVNIGAVGGLVEVLRRIIRVSRDRVMLALAAPLYVYCAAYTLSLVANPDPRFKYLLPVATFLLFPFLYSSWCISRKETVARAVVNASMIACYGALGLALVQFHVYDIRAEGGAGNAIVFATATCLAASLALAGAFARSGTPALALFGAYCAGSIAILYSGSRITWLALFLSTAAILWIHRERRHAWTSAAATSLAAVAVVAVTIAGIQVVPTRVEALVEDWQEISEEGNYDSSLGRRAELWETGLAAIRSSPIIGHGPQSTRPLIRQGFKEIGLNASYSHFHNGFLNAWVEAGIFGALALVALFAVAALLALRTFAGKTAADARFGAVMLVTVTATYVLSGMTGVMVGHDIMDAMLVAFLAVGAYLAGGTSLLEPNSPQDDPQRGLEVKAGTRSDG